MVFDMDVLRRHGFVSEEKIHIEDPNKPNDNDTGAQKVVAPTRIEGTASEVHTKYQPLAKTKHTTTNTSTAFFFLFYLFFFF